MQIGKIVKTVRHAEPLKADPIVVDPKAPVENPVPIKEPEKVKVRR